jgi:enoyl-CoA hydratase/carnithine racemase
MVVVGVTEDPAGVDPSPYDVLLTAGDPLLDPVLNHVGRHPIAAAALAVLLRDADHRSVEAGLAAESAVYSTLQAGPEFAAWRRGRGDSTNAPDPAPPVLVERNGDELRVVLNRPHRHNAVTTALRDALSEALTLAAIDDTIAAIQLSGNGPSFCSGGDLAEFGSLPDPATAHVTRLVRSPARLAHTVSDRLHAHLHGVCMGAGIELAAFATHVVAAEDTVIALPELGLGLIPGAGGTVSLPRRIGRHRTAALALSGAQIDATTALEWGLIDEIAPPPDH